MKSSLWRWKKRLFGVAVLFAVVVRPLGLFAQNRPAICPAFYSFNATRGVHVDVPEYLVLAGIPATYTPQFVYGTGTELASDVGRSGYANYSFSSITSTDGKVLLTEPWILGNCLQVATVNSPADTTWSSLMLVSNNGGNTEWLISTEDDEETCGGGQATTLVPGTPFLAPGISASRIDPGVPLFVCDSGSGDSGGTNGGGGGSVTIDCLYIDYYDGDGTFLYSVQVSCWQI